ncbi:MAG: head-tail connector protein [Rhodospirillaceae bacterium]|nr:head-tail connector protein [Rhodospirillaceae bacterium]
MKKQITKQLIPAAVISEVAETSRDNEKDLTPERIIERYKKSLEQRQVWESHWRECYDFALPRRDGAIVSGSPGEKKTDKLFDGTAPDAVEQLAASLLSELTPPWARWFGLIAGNELSDQESSSLGPQLERISKVLQSNFDRSNFAVEMHQCYLDLVTAGTASLLMEEASISESSAFRFTAVPLSQVVLEESMDGRLDTTFRRSEMTRPHLLSRFPGADIPEQCSEHERAGGEKKYAVIEAVIPDPSGYAYKAVLDPEGSDARSVALLAEGHFRHSPFINFRWLKAPGEIYGRSPVMKALPDIKTANKVVELILKNASIAVTGIWQADDDGVLNPANIKLVPGTIIPKAVGSQGLKALESPGRFDISELVLEKLRVSIRKALLADKLGQIDAPKMTATEVLERSAEMARLLGATYGRLQSELLSPLVARSMAILIRRGEIEDIRIDGATIDLEYRSPLARQQSRQEAQGVLNWFQALTSIGPEAMATINQGAAARWLAKVFAVPPELIKEAVLGEGVLPPEAMEALSALAPQLAAQEVGVSDVEQ